MNILAIHDGHNASACLMQNGKVIYLIQEERVVKEKNYDGFPHKAVALILEKTNLTIDDVDLVGLNGNYMPNPMNRMGIIDYYKALAKGGTGWNIIKNRLKSIPFIAKPFETQNKKKRTQRLIQMGFKESKIRFVEHHTCHASAAYFGNANFKDEILVLTNDGAGDRLCATVSIAKEGKIKRIATTHENHSIGLLYASFTFLTGMVPLEHEYKLMGMAPYADKKGAQKIAQALWEMFELDEQTLSWKFKAGYSIYSAVKHLKEFMYLKRFDHLMGGLQLFTEEFLVRWIKAAIKKTGIRKIALAGGTFMNVKANKLIMELPEVETIYVMPSAGDESNPIGIAYYLEEENNGLKNLQPFTNIYWGVSFEDDTIKKAFEQYTFKSQYKITPYENIEQKAAEILAQGSVVARFKGNEEFGARSLGNRAILANPSKPDVIKEINEMIKNRDFWMPFASSVLDTDMDKYVVWDKNKNLPYYMIMTYDTQPIAHTEMAGGIHPYDKTVRPQMVSQDYNQEYWNLINHFKTITGIGGILNTSLNLHGLPLVHSPEDAFHVMDNSSLKYLAIGNFLVEKV
ncbi:MAG: hypothetical protein EAZ55_06315 [Cytophagales bacterium]|nr:MAG: hypothetical protein EAZ55_06315 [Cytophagales bacterium]